MKALWKKIYPVEIINRVEHFGKKGRQFYFENSDFNV